MLEKTELIDGKLAKELDSLLKDYMDVKGKMDDLKKVQDETVARIKEICDHKASFETLNYYFKMGDRKDNDIFNKKGFEKDYPELFENYITRKDTRSLVMGDIILKGVRS